MNHAITIGGLLLSIGAFGGFISACFGILMTFAAGMSDAPEDSMSSQGCVVAIVGALFFAFCTAGLIL